MMMKMSRLFAALSLSPWSRGLGRGGAQTFGLLAFAMAISLATGQALARPTPPPLEDPAHWATVTHPGNAPYPYAPLGSAPRGIGRVDYDYRISRTEVTGAEWFEFVQAYAPYVATADRRRSEFTSFLVRYNLLPGGGVSYTLGTGAENFPVSVGWRFAAKYCNWLHNGKGSGREAFENGVFDTSTFEDNPDGTFTDQRQHSPGARFWLATEDEWVKAAYFDPDKGGEGVPGYWQYPITSDTLPVSGGPGVGQTNAGKEGFATEVGAYANVTSPWGLWDLSGGHREWLENAIQDPARPWPHARQSRGSEVDHPRYEDFDGIEARMDGDSAYSGMNGIRLVSVVPSPGSGTVLLLCGPLLFSRRRWNGTQQ